MGSGLGGSGQGTSTAALVFGKNPPTSIGTTESWNGTTWTNENQLITARVGTSGSGTQTLALNFGGEPFSTATNVWDGTGFITRTITTTSE